MECRSKKLGCLIFLVCFKVIYGCHKSFSVEAQGKIDWMRMHHDIPLKFDYRSPESLNVSMGDIISCKISFAANHLMLASSPTTVIHTPGADEGKEQRTKIIEELYTEAVKGGNYSSCALVTKMYDWEIFYDLCHAGKHIKRYNNSEAVERARVSVDDFYKRTTWYDVLSCNCQHWVTGWKYNITWSNQVNDKLPLFKTYYASSSCEAPGVKSCQNYGR